jgi:RNA polymerase sigma-70 factor (ECF subfamily)
LCPATVETRREKVGREAGVAGSVTGGLGGAALDRALVEQAGSGDLEAYDALVQPRVDRLYHTALAILRHEADARDAVQDSCVQAWRQLSRLRDADRFDAWLGRILLNTCRERLRSRRRTVVREIALADGPDDGPELPGPGPALADRVAEVDAVRRAFLRLRPDERIVLALHHGEQRGIAEIADLLETPQGTVKWRLHEARKALARALERER